MATIGVDVGGTNLRVARVGDTGAIEAIRHAGTHGDPVEAERTIIALARDVMSPAVAGIGIGIPGRVDFPARRVLSGGFLDLSRVDLAANVETALGLPVLIDSDANLALLAEAHHGAARGCRDVAMLTIGTGIGAAALVDGRLLRGRRSAGQFGHLTVDHAGLPCACGRRGCVETTSSGTALGRLIREARLPADTRAESLLDAAEAADGVARDVIRRWALPLRAAIDSLVAALDPERVVLGGGLGGAAARSLAFAPALSEWYQAPVVAAELGDSAGVIGAAWAARRPETDGP
jgi:glucokinase